MTASFFYEYEKSSGRLLRTGYTTPESIEHITGTSTTTVAEGEADFATQYVVDGKPVDRPRFPKFDKTAIKVGEEAALRGLPAPAAVTVNGVAHTVTDGEFILAGTSAGRFAVTVSAWPYLDYAEVITCG
jgi:hypothetical protein